jgi:hypothetical protein
LTSNYYDHVNAVAGIFIAINPMAASRQTAPFRARFAPRHRQFGPPARRVIAKHG